MTTLLPKILLTGANGQVGWELRRTLGALGEVVALDSRTMDLSKAEAVRDTVRAIAPAIIVNPAAYTAVDKAESEPDRAHAVNAVAPGVLAEEAARLDALLVHYSTDYVFDGSGAVLDRGEARPWREDDATGPLSVYGDTKHQGEQAIVGSGCAHLILRTSWVYAARGGNFAKTMLRLAQERERLTVIDDQWGAPTGAELIANVSAHAIVQTRQQPDKAGIYHLAAAGHTTWFAYAKHVLAQARQAQPAIKIKATEVASITTADYPTPARRPLNSRLDTRKLQSTFGLTLPTWQHGVNRMLTEIL